MLVLTVLGKSGPPGQVYCHEKYEEPDFFLLIATLPLSAYAKYVKGT